MATVPSTRIHINKHYTGTREEIMQVWKMISENRTISVRTIAAKMGAGSSRVHGIIGWLKRLGYVSCDNKAAYDVHVSYMEIQS